MNPILNSLFGIMLGSSAFLLALPSGGKVAHGRVNVVPGLNLLEVQANGDAIILWDQFNIGSKEAVSFTQSQGKSGVLNRVIGGSVSEIFGKIQANCPVYLINPQGFFIGASAEIETAGFIASTADLSNDLFCLGDSLIFEPLGDGKIVNFGSIQSTQGDVLLIARSIDNQGQIKCPQGDVVFATTEVVLNPRGKRKVFIRLTEPSEKDEGINNNGTVEALNVEFQTLSPYEKAIHHTGFVEALKREENNGRIYLVAENGQVVVNGSLSAESGEVEVQGKTVVFEENGAIDVSGFRGGNIVIGKKGVTEEIYTDSKAQLLANGHSSDGGKMSIWGDKINHFHGSAEAKALGETGDGGFIEISSGESVWVSSHPDLRSFGGKSGLFLFDPGSVTISSGASTGPSTFGSSYINTQLGLGSFTISTAGATSGVETITINSSASINWSTANTLTLIGRRNITMAAGGVINNTHTATAFTALEMIGGSSLSSGTFSGISISGTIQTSRGNIDLTGTSGDSSTATSNFGILVSGSGVKITTADGNINMVGVSRGTGQNSQGIRITGGVELTGSGSIAMDGTSGFAGNGSDGVTVTTFGTTGIIRSTLTGTGPITLLGSSRSVNLGSTGVNLNSGGQAIALGSSSITFQGTTLATGTSSEGVLLENSSSVSSASGKITFEGTTLASGTNSFGVGVRSSSTVESTTGDIEIVGISSGAATTGCPGVIVSSAGSFIRTGSGNISIHGDASGRTVNTSPGISISGGGNITSTGLGGSIELIGTGSSGTDTVQGVLIDGNTSLISSNSAPVTIEGFGTGTGTGTDGVAFTSGGKLTTTSGIVTITGNASAQGTTDNGGVTITGGGQITTESADILITGTGSGVGINNRGIQILNGGTINTTDGGSIILTGTGSSIGTSSEGVLLENDSSVSSTSGKIRFDGTTLASGTNSVGVGVRSSGTVESTTGDIEIVGISSGAATTGCPGVIVSSAGSFIRTGSGNISIHGDASGRTVNTSPGISISGGGNITSTGLGGSIELIGTGSSGTDTVQGVLIDGNTSLISSNSAPVTIEGFGTGTGTGTDGVAFTSGGKLTTTSGIVTITGNASAQGTTDNGGVTITGGGQITTESADILITGTGSGVGINNRGIQILNGGTINTTDGGSIILTGTGSSIGTSFNEGIFLTDALSEISSTSGQIQMTGTAGNGTINGINIENGASVISNVSGNIFINSPNRFILQNNSQVKTLGIGGSSLNDITIDTGGVDLMGGSLGSALVSTVNGNISVNSSDSVLLSGSTVPNASAEILTVLGNIGISSLGNIEAIGGSASGTDALIHSTQQGSITLNALNLVVEGGAIAGPSGVVTARGDIDVTCVQNCDYTALVSGAPAVMQTYGSDLTIVAGGSISLAGYTIYSTPSPTSNILLIAGQNISVGNNSQVVVNGTAQSSLTLVVDNNFPNAPGIGFGQFILDAGGIISSGGGTPVRIYTARRIQNSINSLINGSVFTPDSLNMNTSSEQWDTYYPGGTYGGSAFKLYYKEITEEGMFFQSIAANLVELSDLLPLLYGRLRRYHFQICQKDRQSSYCDPTFSPYGSFIFEDDLFWIGTQF